MVIRDQKFFKALDDRLGKSITNRFKVPKYGDLSLPPPAASVDAPLIYTEGNSPLFYYFKKISFAYSSCSHGQHALTSG